MPIPIRKVSVFSSDNSKLRREIRDSDDVASRARAVVLRASRCLRGDGLPHDARQRRLRYVDRVPVRPRVRRRHLQPVQRRDGLDVQPVGGHQCHAVIES